MKKLPYYSSKTFLVNIKHSIVWTYQKKILLQSGGQYWINLSKTTIILLSSSYIISLMEILLTFQTKEHFDFFPPLLLKAILKQQRNKKRTQILPLITVDL